MPQRLQRHNCNLIELKLAPSENNVMEFTGYGAVFNNVDAYGDVIEPGAFAKCLDQIKSGKLQWPAMLSQHGGWGMSTDDITPIGVWADMAEDKTGLKVTGRLADTARGQENYALLKMEPRPAITGLSIGYYAKEFELGTQPGEPRRKLKTVELVEISLVTFPANPKATINDVKSTGDFTERQFEEFLRDSGFSKKEAQTIIAKGFRSLKTQWDADNEQIGTLAAMIKQATQSMRT